MKKAIINFILFILSIVLFTILFPVSFLYSILKNLIYLRFRKVFIGTALMIDKIANTVCEDFFNDTLRKDNCSIRFGDSRYTISYVLGNIILLGYTKFELFTIFKKTFTYKKVYNATLIGEFLINILDNIDENHCVNSTVVM